MTSEQREGLLDLFLKCKLATEAWKDQAPINQRNASDFKELSEVKDLVVELEEMNTPEFKIVYVLANFLPPALYRKHFSEMAKV